MHPIINQFVNSSEKLPVILEKYYDKEQYLETVFLKLIQFWNIENVDPQIYIEIDEAIIKGHPDIELYLHFLSNVIIFTCSRQRLERAKVIQSIGTSISHDKIHSMIRSHYKVSIAILRYYEGKSVACNFLIKELMETIDKKSPRYIGILINIATLIATEGRLNDLEKEELELLNSSKNESYGTNCINIELINSIFTGNFKEGFVLIEEYKRKFKGETPLTLQYKMNLLKILSGELNEKNYTGEFFKLCAKTSSLINLGNYEEALQYTILLQKSKWDGGFSLNFEYYFPLHLALCMKNKGLAWLLLQEKEQKKSKNYLDDFFLARIQLLEMNLNEAYETFARLIDNVNHYGAMNRLVFELQFAKEMKTSDILFLMNGNRDKDGLKVPTIIKKDIPVVPIQQEKGVKLLIGDSLALLQVKKLIKKFANLKEPVIVTGETGTGKELVARAIHDEGPNSKEPFLAINCSALTESLLQSELFGYVAGAFTGAQKERLGIFEAAGKGSIFLDEFGDISSKMQVSLLRVLESNEIRLIGGTSTRQIECKIIIATNIDLQQAVKDKKFREDLYFRLIRFDIQLPPLRERQEDIPRLIEHFLKGNSLHQAQEIKLSKKLQIALIEYHWPGNIRELKNEIERLKILHSDKALLNLEDFDFTRLQGMGSNNQIVENEIKLPSLILNKKKKLIEEDQILNIIKRGSKAEQRQIFIKELFQKYKRLTRGQIMEITAVSPVTASKELEMLCQAGFITRRTPTKSYKSHYFVLVE